MPPAMGTLKRTVVIMIFLVCHTFISAVLILCSFGINRLLLAFGDPKLFDWVPFRYMFDAMDAGMTVSYIVLGVVGATVVFREADNAPK